MVSNPDLADVIGQAAAGGAKVILAGDTQQLQAVENGGGMFLLADALGYVQLTEPLRSRAVWEQAAGAARPSSTLRSDASARWPRWSFSVPDPWFGPWCAELVRPGVSPRR
jgi:hypothetical protein